MNGSKNIHMTQGNPTRLLLSFAIPMLIGWNREDMAFFMGADPEAFTLDETALAARAETMLGGQAEDALALYRQLHAD